MTKPLPAAGYYRISQARDGMHAPAIYEQDIRRWAGYRQIEIGEIFADLDHSGFNRSEARPALAELVRRRSEFSAIVVPKLSRFGRSLSHLTKLFEMFDREGIALVFLDLGMDTSTSQGRLLRNIMAAFAEYESAVRGDYTRANARYATQNGRPSGGVAPYGYNYDKPNRTYVVHRQHADVVRFIYRRYDEGQSQFGIARELAEQAIPTAKGKPFWEANKVGRLIDNPAYAALLLLDGKLVPANWEPLIEPQLWHRVAKRRMKSREKWSRARHPKRLLAGLIYCGDCGRKAYFTARGGGLPGRYKCAHNSVEPHCNAGGTNAARAEEFVTERFLERARYFFVQGEGGRFIPQGQWELCSTQERRMLLKATIERVVIEQLRPGQRSPGRAGRSLRIVWKDEPSPVEPPPVNRHTKPTGRGRQLARSQVADAAAARDEEFKARSERSKKAWREWKDHQRRMIKERTSRSEGG